MCSDIWRRTDGRTNRTDTLVYSVLQASTFVSLLTKTMVHVINLRVSNMCRDTSEIVEYMF